MKRIHGWVRALAIFAFAGVLAASADDYTGDPAADGWLLHGNSLANGIYIRGAAGFSFDVYSDTFTITTNSPLWDGTLADPNSGFWHPGDQILGLGGVNESGYIYEPRMVAKFGAASATFSPSTLPSPAGNGNGSFSGGNAGNGGVQVDYEYEFTSGGTNLDPADQNGGLELPDHVLYYSGGSSNIDPDYGAVLALFQQDGQGRDVLQSWEVALDLTALSDPNRAAFGSQVPVVGGKLDMALQENLGDYTDALVVPEPSTCSLVIISLATFGWTLKRRRGSACWRADWIWQGAPLVKVFTSGAGDAAVTLVIARTLMLPIRCSVLLLGLLVGLLVGARSSSAQFTGNFQTNTISGVVSNWTGDYLIGSNTFADALLIQNGGALSNGNGYIGYEIGADNNSALVSDSNSMWNVAGVLVVGNSGSSNQLVVTNGANVTCGLLSIGSNSAAGTNTVAVTGTNSLLSVSGDIVVGTAGQMNQLSVGGTAGVVCNNGTIGVAGSSNTVLVMDSGSSWTLSGNLTIGPGGPGNQLVLTNGGGVTTAALDVRSGTLTLNGGGASVGSFTVTNGAQSVFTFNGGYLASGATQISNTQPTGIGDGTSTATFQLNGGAHTFVDGLRVLSNAAVTGCGTINGNVTIDPGGVVAASCGGRLTFTGIVTNNGDIQVLNGTVLESYGTLVNNGIIDLFDAGPTNFHGAFINNGTIRNGANIVISGNDVIIKATPFFIFPPRPHIYNLQVTPLLTPANWVDTGASQLASGGLLTFTDVGGATNRPSRFYRIRITP